MNRLSVVIVTRQSGRWIERLLKQAKDLYADELITLVDKTSTDDTFDICKRYADYIEWIEVPGYVEPVLEYAYSLPRCEWVLRLDDDELMGEKFVVMRDDILRFPAEAIQFPRYAIVGEEQDHYIVNKPWYPDIQTRLFKKGHVKAPKEIHFETAVLGRTVMLYDQINRDGVHIMHLKFRLKNRSEREELARHYDSISPGAGSNDEYGPHQLPENYMMDIQPCKERIAEPGELKEDEFPRDLTIETTTLCNSRCRTCPHEMIRRDTIMPMERFTKLIDECAGQGVKCINLAEYGEPLMDPLLVQRVANVRERLPDTRVGFFTNASLLTENKIGELLDAGLSFIVFSLDGTDAATYESIRRGLKYDEVIHNIKAFLAANKERGKSCKTRVHMVRTSANDVQWGMIQNTWKYLVDEVTYADCEGRDSEFPVYQDNSRRMPCSPLFRNMHILTDGTVVMCCQDWKGQYPMGNAFEMGIKKVWHGEAYQHARELHGVGRKTVLPLCAKCKTAY